MSRFVVFAMVAVPAVGHADRMLDRVLADNPPLALLARRVDKVHLELSSCDYFGANDTAGCTRHMDATQLANILASVHAPSAREEHLYCASYNRPLVADPGFQPLTGFQCWMKMEASSATLELTCDETGHGNCSLHYRASNDDEDMDYRYDFRVVGRGRAMVIEDDLVHFSYEQNN
jgi:hypothetical protein